jgi:glycosyltransferase involved in cell wall biosynthesis
MSEIISKKLSTHSFVSTDLAIIIPTKDRPKEVRRLLKSILELDCKVGRIIIIASGQDIQDEVMPFVDCIPIKYFFGEPGQIKQRNKGISLLDNSTKLVATIDDEVVFQNDSVSEMIKFWNSIEPETAGVGFNIINQQGHDYNWLKWRLGLSVPSPGKVMRSGKSTSIINVRTNIKTEWLNGGATVWQQKVLERNKNKEILSRWATCEDLIFSYPIGKRYPLYICKNSKIKILCLVDRKDESIELLLYKGKTQFLWGLYFVSVNTELSYVKYILYNAVRLLSLTVNALRNIETKHNIFWAFGIIKGMFLCIPFIFNRKSIKEIIEEAT